MLTSTLAACSRFIGVGRLLAKCRSWARKAPWAPRAFTAFGVSDFGCHHSAASPSSDVTM
jgi:hypothetical protein